MKSICGIVLLFSFNLAMAMAQSEVNSDLVPDSSELIIMPEYPEGDQAVLNYISKNLSYPKEARSSGIVGTVHVGFVVESDGSVGLVHVVQGCHPILDKEAIRVVQTIIGYRPGTKAGKFVPVRLTLPIRFILHGGPQDWEVAYGRAIEYLKEGNLVDAAKQIDKALGEVGDWFINGYAKRAEIALKGGNSVKAQSDYEKGLRLDSTRVDMLMGRAKCLFARNMPNEAFVDLERAAVLNPFSHQPMAAKGLFCFGAGRFEEAERYFTEAIGKERNDGELYYNRGMAFARLRRMEEACRDWNRAVSLGNKNAATVVENACR